MKKEQFLKNYYGYTEFREGQEELIDSILDGKDTLGIMPTGAGKSICFQIPALIMEGITIVISPLISLMKDQVGSLNQMGIHAAFLNSSLTQGQYFKALEFARQGRYKIIYVAPERLMTDTFLSFALNADISMISVDEVHCVSQWGQDFRPDYLKIMDFVKALEKRPVISAFTATATKEVKDDIIKILQLENPTVVTTGFDRSNLFFAVKQPKDKYAHVLSYLEKNPLESGIVYCSTRNNVEEVCSNLIRDGYRASRYHAGLSDSERKHNQDDFIFDNCQIMVATNAFGMGIDKSNVRFVIHYNMPKNMESYYQEAGRAGRDGEPAKCILLYSGQDVVTNQFFIENSRDNGELSYDSLEVVKERDRERLRKMTYYCFTNGCLRDYILRYFGEYNIDSYCGNCSNCLTEFTDICITFICRDLIGCICTSHERYGINVILDTLRGSANAKIKKFRMDLNPYYGCRKDTTIVRLRQIFNHLLVEEYIVLTDTEYPVVKVLDKGREFMSQITQRFTELTDEDESLYNGIHITMKLPKEEYTPKEKKENTSKKKYPKALAGLETKSQKDMFEVLRTLRRDIASEEKVPPYIIFSDKTLTQMCILKPSNKDEMLEVSGVGAVKFKKYGERFLGAINNI